MHVLAVSTCLGVIRLEQGILQNPDVGLHNRFCDNKGSGGERVSKSAGPDVPYFLYVVIGKVDPPLPYP